MKELYQTVMSAVCRHTGIREDNVLGSNREECVDARYILIHILALFLTDEEIAGQTKLPRQSVNRIRNRFAVKMNKWSIRNNLHEISSELAHNPLTSSIIAH